MDGFTFRFMARQKLVEEIRRLEKDMFVKDNVSFFGANALTMTNDIERIAKELKLPLTITERENDLYMLTFSLDDVEYYKWSRTYLTESEE